MRKMMAMMVSVLMLMVCIAHAEEHDLPGVATNRPPSLWGYSISELLMSKYYGSYFGGTFYPGPFSFTDFVASRKNSITVGPLKLDGALTIDVSVGRKLDSCSYNNNGGDEYDLTIDQRVVLWPTSHPVFLDVGVGYLALYPLQKVRDDAFDEFVRIDAPIGSSAHDEPYFTPYIDILHYHVVGNGFQNVGWFFFGGAYRNQKLGNLRVFGKPLLLNIDWRMGASAGVFGSNPGVEYNRLSFSLPIQYKHWLFVPTIIGQLAAGQEQTYVYKNEIFLTFFAKYSF